MLYAILKSGRVKMPERDPIDLIKEQMESMEGLSGLHANHDTFKRWHGETKTILEKAFTPKSIHCQTFGALKFREMGHTLFPRLRSIRSMRHVIRRTSRPREIFSMELSKN